MYKPKSDQMKAARLSQMKSFLLPIALYLNKYQMFKTTNKYFKKQLRKN